MKKFVHTLHNSTGAEWREVRSKTYSLKEIAEYLADCMQDPQNDTSVYFTIREGGDLYISTSNDEVPCEVRASGFTVIED